MNKLQPEWQEEVYAEKIDVGLWRQILRLARPYRRYIGWAIVSTVALAVGDETRPLPVAHGTCAAVRKQIYVHVFTAQ